MKRTLKIIFKELTQELMEKREKLLNFFHKKFQWLFKKSNRDDPGTIENLSKKEKEMLHKLIELQSQDGAIWKQRLEVLKFIRSDQLDQQLPVTITKRGTLSNSSNIFHGPFQKLSQRQMLHKLIRLHFREGVIWKEVLNELKFIRRAQLDMQMPLTITEQATKIVEYQIKQWKIRDKALQSYIRLHGLY